jgi:hypothetical protein
MSYCAYNEKVPYTERGRYFAKFRGCHNSVKSDENGYLSGFIGNFSLAELVVAQKKSISLSRHDLRILNEYAVMYFCRLHLLA